MHIALLVLRYCSTAYTIYCTTKHNTCVHTLLHTQHMCTHSTTHTTHVCTQYYTHNTCVHTV